ncbi:MAG: ABC transporter ATP-binding protein [Rhizomicrobium sp.]
MTQNATLAPVGEEGPAPLLDLRHVNKTFSRGKNAWRALKDISFALRPGESVALIGANGAGKTTLIRLIGGVLAPDAGTISIDGRSLRGYSSIAQGVGVVAEGARDLYGNLTVLENMEYFGMLRGMKKRRQRATDICAALGLAGESGKLVRLLSRGNRQKAAIAATLLFSPALLIMDEPTLGMDQEATRLFAETIVKLKTMGPTLLLATHQLEIADELCDRVLVLNSGELRYDGPIRVAPQEGARVVEYEILLARPFAGATGDFDAAVKGQRIAISCTPERLYDFLRTIAPAEIVAVEQLSSGTKNIFRRYGGDPGR